MGLFKKLILPLIPGAVLYDWYTAGKNYPPLDKDRFIKDERTVFPDVPMYLIENEMESVGNLRGLARISTIGVGLGGEIVSFIILNRGLSEFIANGSYSDLLIYGLAAAIFREALVHGSSDMKKGYS